MGRIVKEGIVNSITRCDWIKWRELTGVLCDKKVMLEVKKCSIELLWCLTMMYGFERGSLGVTDVTKNEKEYIKIVMTHVE